MSLDFNAIPYDLRVLVARKFDFWTLHHFRLSSNTGFKAGINALQTSVLDVEKISCEDNIVRFTIEIPFKNKKVIRQWRYIREFPKLPFFSVSCIEKRVPNFSINYYHSLIREAKFIRTKAKVFWSRQDSDERELFTNMVEKFNITQFTSLNYEDDHRYIALYLPQFLKMESIDVSLNCIPSYIFMNLQALTLSNVRALTDPPMNFLVNDFLWEWMRDYREILFFGFSINQRSSLDAIFDGLPNLLICSNINRIRDDCYKKEIHLLDRGDKQLRIEITQRFFTASEVLDYNAFQRDIDRLVRAGLTERVNKDGVVKPSKWKKRFYTRERCIVS